MIAFDNSYAQLPERFYTKLNPTAVQKPALIAVNDSLADLLKIDSDFLRSEAGLAVVAGNEVPTGAEPLAAAYAGHQFGHFVPQLGDGRAVLLGEVVGRDNIRRDIQLKGAGRTPYSRMGDGRAAIGPVLREYLVSEAMYHLGIPTTRTLAAVTTGEYVYRERPLPGAVLARVAQSHIRVGTFQYFAARQDIDALRMLSHHVIERHYPEVQDTENPYLGLLEAVLKRQASLIAKWLGVGFIHGVMNTDNMSIAGETIDYGPCAFLDEYHPEKVFSSVDQFGRYAFGNQPSIGLWNLTRLAECLLPLIDDDQEKAIASAQTVLDLYSTEFQTAYLNVFSAKLGILNPIPDDLELIGKLLRIVQDVEGDFTQTFNYLTDLVIGKEMDSEKSGSAISNHDDFPEWSRDWNSRLQLDDVKDEEKSSLLMLQSNPRIVPRNHLIEDIIKDAEESQNFFKFNEMMGVLSSPFTRDAIDVRYTNPPKMDERVQQTFCGT